LLKRIFLFITNILSITIPRLVDFSVMGTCQQEGKYIPKNHGVMNFPASCGFRIICGTTLGGSSISGVLHGKIIVICSKGFDTNGAIHVVRALVGYKPDI